MVWMSRVSIYRQVGARCCIQCYAMWGTKSSASSVEETSASDSLSSLEVAGREEVDWPLQLGILMDVPS